MGALSLTDRVKALDFENKDPHRHAEVGYRLLKLLDPFAGIADIIRYHHVSWDHGRGLEHAGGRVPESSHVIHLADRIAVSIDQHAGISEQAQTIIATMRAYSGRDFKPEHVEAFAHLAGKEYFGLDISYRLDAPFLQQLVKGETVIFDNQALVRLAQFFSQMIDFRSPFTATHSSGVAASAVAIAEQMAFSEQECLTMQIAGYLHDLGKLAVPAEILEKPGKLTAAEWRLIKAHTYHGYRALEPIADLRTINEWGSFHHERLDGKGYPFHLDRRALSLGSRIMAVADIFTATAEDRPYRQGMKSGEILKLIKRLCLDGALDASVVNTLGTHFDDINYRRAIAQQTSTSDYRFFIGDSHLPAVKA